MRPRISIIGSVRRLVGRLVGWLVGRLITHSLKTSNSCNFSTEKWSWPSKRSIQLLIHSINHLFIHKKTFIHKNHSFKEDALLAYLTLFPTFLLDYNRRTDKTSHRIACPRQKNRSQSPKRDKKLCLCFSFSTLLISLLVGDFGWGFFPHLLRVPSKPASIFFVGFWMTKFKVFFSDAVSYVYVWWKVRIF